MTDKPDDRELEQYLKGGSALSRRYRDASREGAPPQLDETVLALARAEVSGKPRTGPWFAGLALAASLVLAVNLVWNLREQPAPVAQQELDRLDDESPIAEKIMTEPQAQPEPEARAPAVPPPVLAKRREAPAPSEEIAADHIAGSGAAYESRDEPAEQKAAVQEEQERSARLNAAKEDRQTLAASPVEAGPSGRGGSDRQKRTHGWGLSAGEPDYGIGLASYRPRTGNNSLTLQSKVAQPQSSYGALRNKIPAAPFRGHPVVFEAWLRAQSVAGLAELWLRIDDANHRELRMANMHDRPITGDQDWQAHYLILDVPAEAEWINFGVALHGTGRVWVDTARIESLSPDTAANAASARFYDFEERQLEH